MPMLRSCRFVRRMLTTIAVLAMTSSTDARQSLQRRPTFRSGVSLTYVNVVVRDKDGNIVRGLTKDDFTIPRGRQDPDHHHVRLRERAVRGDSGRAAGRARCADSADDAGEESGRQRRRPPLRRSRRRSHSTCRNRRLIVLFFDLSSMQPEEVERAAASAHDYVEKRLPPADLIAIASFSTSLADRPGLHRRPRDAVARAIDAPAATASASRKAARRPARTRRTTKAFAADDTEFNIFNTDRRLDALQPLAGRARPDPAEEVGDLLQQRHEPAGDRQPGAAAPHRRSRRSAPTSRSTPADMRGLQAIVPGGDATQASRRGTSHVLRRLAPAISSIAWPPRQDTLDTMAEDTGGRAFFDSNRSGRCSTR